MRTGLIATLALLTAGCGAASRTEPRIVLPPACGAGGACRAQHALVWNDSNPIPGYPAVLRAAGVEGEVAVRFIVSKEGVVDSSSIAVLKSTNKAFVAPTVQAISRWGFGALSGRGELRPRQFSLNVRYTQGATCVGPDRSIHSAWSAVASTSTLTVTACELVLVPRDQVARNRAAAGMPPLEPPR